MKASRLRKSIWAATLVAFAAAALALTACGGGTIGSMATSPLPTPTAGGTLVFQNVGKSGSGGKGDIYVVNTDGSGLKALAEDPDWADHPSWSPDGSTIVWSAYVDGEATLWVMNADGTDKRSLAAVPLPGLEAVWSPDGTQIAFFREDGEYGPCGIWVVNADGSGLRQVTPYSEAGDRHPDWASDGRIYFVHGSTRLFAVNPDGSGRQQVTKGYGVGDFAVSPDGKTLAVHDFTNDRILAVPVDGAGSPLTLLDQASRFRPGGLVGRWAPVWSPDAKSLALVTGSWGGHTGPRIYIVNADGTGLSAVPGVDAVMDLDWRPE